MRMDLKHVGRLQVGRSRRCIRDAKNAFEGWGKMAEELRGDADGDKRAFSAVC